MNPNSRIFTSTYRVKWLKSKLTQTVKINIDENNLKLSTLFASKLTNSHLTKKSKCRSFFFSKSLSNSSQVASFRGRNIIPKPIFVPSWNHSNTFWCQIYRSILISTFCIMLSKQMWSVPLKLSKAFLSLFLFPIAKNWMSKSLSNQWFSKSLEY